MEDATRLIRRAVRGWGAAAALLGAAIGLPAHAQGAGASSTPEAAAAPDSAHVLAWQAREAADRDEHVAAVERARRAIELDPALRDEMSLLIAHQLTWADHPDEAIPWYRERLARHPHEREAQLGIARALSWTGDLEEARLFYREVLDENPDDEEAAVGLARMDAWDDDPGAAARGYREVLARHPESHDARLGLADAQDDRGLNRDAERLYQQMLDDDADDADAREGLARARWWMGEEDLALATLGEPTRDSGRELRAAILADRRPSLDIAGARWTDADDQELRTATLTASRGIGGGRRLLGEMEYLRVKDPATPWIDGVRMAGGLDWRTGRAFAAHARAGALLVGKGDVGTREAIDVGAGEIRIGQDIKATYFLWELWTTWTPIDRFRTDLSYARVPLDSPRSLARGIRADVLSLGMDRGFTDRLTGHVEGAWASYTDDNNRLSVEGELETGPFREKRLAGWFSVGASAFRFDDTPDHGYYAPETYDALWLGGRAELKIGKSATLTADARLSTEHEKGGDRFGVLSGGGELRVPLGRAVTLGAFARKSTSRFDTSGGYERQGAGVSLSRSW